MVEINGARSGPGGVRTDSWTEFILIIQEYVCTLPGLKSPMTV